MLYCIAGTCQAADACLKVASCCHKVRVLNAVERGFESPVVGPVVCSLALVTVIVFRAALDDSLQPCIAHRSLENNPRTQHTNLMQHRAHLAEPLAQRHHDAQPPNMC